MKRTIININEEKCNGCGLCATACHEGAIGMVDGKAKLLREDFCDGLGDCLPACPTGAITFEEREAPAYDEEAVKANSQAAGDGPSELAQWPIQIKLASPMSPYFEDCDLLIAADCTAFAYGNFHSDYIKGRITLIGCPKLDNVDYSEKLADIFISNNIKSVTLTRMWVPCCGGMTMAVEKAIKKSGKDIPLKIVTFDGEGNIL